MATSESLPPIFKLNTHCCDEIFDYLSIKDLHSLGQTCKAMQQVAGQYFKQNYWAAGTFSQSDGIYLDPLERYNSKWYNRIQISGFRKYIACISHDSYERSLEYIRKHARDFESINSVRLVGGELRKKVEYLRAILPKIETMQIDCCWCQGDIHEDLLTHCSSLKRLLVKNALSITFQEQRNPWLLRRYTQLEYLELIPESQNVIPELNDFFAINTTVRGFSTSSKCLWANREQLLKSSVKLDILGVNCFEQFESFQPICELLNKLYENEFYQRIYLYVESVDEEASRHLASVKGVHQLCIKLFTEMYSLSHLSGIKELAILTGATPTTMRTFANHLVNIERLYLKFGTINDILPFVQQSSKLSKIYFGSGKNEALKISLLNRERAKLTGARKVMVYVPDNIFLKTKWTMGNINLESVELRRINSSACDYNYY